MKSKSLIQQNHLITKMLNKNCSFTVQFEIQKIPIFVLSKPLILKTALWKSPTSIN